MKGITRYREFSEVRFWMYIVHRLKAHKTKTHKKKKQPPIENKPTSKLKHLAC